MSQADIYEQRTLIRLASGQDTEQDILAIKHLSDGCGRYGCVYTKTSRTSRSMPICPGWRDALEANKRLKQERKELLSRQITPKPRALAKLEKQALENILDETVSTLDVYLIELLAKECKEMTAQETIIAALPHQALRPVLAGVNRQH